MRSLLLFCFGLMTAFSFVKICEGSTVDVQEANGETSAYTTDVEVENEEVESLAEEIESELQEAIADMVVENEENTAVVGSSKSDLPLMFPSLLKSGKSHRKLNKDMAVKVASIVEQAVMLVANDILQTTVLMQIDPEDFLQVLETNTTSTSE